jgi:hypothetical protein
MAENRYSLVILSLVAAAWAIPYSLHGQEAKVTPPNLNSILDSMERTMEQNPARSRPYEVTREYKVFHADEPKPISDVTAQISFSPRAQKHSPSQMHRAARAVKNRKRRIGARSSFC